MKSIVTSIVITGVVAVALVLSGCPVGTSTGGLSGLSVPKDGDVMTVTVDGDTVSDVVTWGSIAWYKFEGTAEAIYRIVATGNQGLVLSIYLLRPETDTSKEMLDLLWVAQGNQPVQYQTLTDEPDDKANPAIEAVAVNNFAVPEAGTYYISIETFDFTQGQGQQQSYAYYDTFSYTLGVETAADRENAPALAVADQSATAAWTAGALSPGGENFYSVAITKGEALIFEAMSESNLRMAVQFPDGDNIINAFLTDDAPQRWTATLTGDILVRVDESPNGNYPDFGTIPYEVRVLRDDHAGDATVLVAGKEETGFLSEGDADVFTFEATDAGDYKVQTTGEVDTVLSVDGGNNFIDDVDIDDEGNETDAEGVHESRVVTLNEGQNLNIVVQTVEPDFVTGAYGVKVTAL